MIQPHPRLTLFPYTTLFRSSRFAAKLRVVCWSHEETQREMVFRPGLCRAVDWCKPAWTESDAKRPRPAPRNRSRPRSEEHTSELQSRFDLVCRLLLEKKKKY